MWEKFLEILTSNRAAGGRSVNVTVAAESGLATEATQLQVLDAVQNIEITAENINLDVDGVETLIAETNDILNDQTTQLNNIDTQTDTIIANQTNGTQKTQIVDSAGASVENKVSTVNSTTTPLNTLATFTGTGEDVLTYNSVVVACYTDYAGTLYVDFSTDGTNWDSTLSYLVAAATNEVHRITITRRYFRVRFYNSSASNQTYLRLQSILGNQTALNQSLNSNVQQDADAMNVRPTDFHYEVAMGRRTGNTTWNKFGYNGDIDVGTETIWSAGGTFTRLTAASTLSVVSTSASDGVAGTGAQNIIIYGVNANFDAITEVVVMNGLTPVITTNSFFGVNRMSVYVTGSSDSNVGVITATATGGGATLQGHMPAAEGTSQQAIFFSQAGHTLLMDWLFINVNKTGGSSPRITVRGWVYSFVSTAKYLVFYDVIDTSIENHIELIPSQPFIVGEKSILYFEATTDVNNSTASCRFSFIETKNI